MSRYAVMGQSAATMYNLNQAYNQKKSQMAWNAEQAAYDKEMATAKAKADRNMSKMAPEGAGKASKLLTVGKQSSLIPAGAQ